MAMEKRKRSETTTDDGSSKKEDLVLTLPQSSSPLSSGKKRSRSESIKLCVTLSFGLICSPTTPEFIEHHSAVLATAFNNKKSIEGETQTYRLEDVSSSCFRLFSQWIYKQDFDMFMPKPEDLAEKPMEKKIRESIIAQDLNLAQLWVLGDKFIIPELQNKVIDKLLILRCSYFNPGVFQYIFANTSDTSNLRKWFVDLTTMYSSKFNCGTSWYKESHRDMYPKKMLFDLLDKAGKIMSAGAKMHEMVASDYYVQTDP